MLLCGVCLSLLGPTSISSTDRRVSPARLGPRLVYAQRRCAAAVRDIAAARRRLPGARRQRRLPPARQLWRAAVRVRTVQVRARSPKR